MNIQSQHLVFFLKVFWCAKIIWMRTHWFVMMPSKLIVFISLIQQMFVVSKQIYFFTWACVWRVWPLKHLILALNAHTPSCWKTILMSYCVYHSSRKPLALSQSRYVTKSECLLMVFDNFQILNFMYSS